MTNWCRTTVVAAGDPHDVAQVVAFVATPAGAARTATGHAPTAFDLERIVPLAPDAADDEWWTVKHWGTGANTDAAPPRILADGRVAVWSFACPWSGPSQAVVALARMFPAVVLAIVEDEPGNEVLCATACRGDEVVAFDVHGDSWQPHHGGAALILPDGSELTVADPASADDAEEVGEPPAGAAPARVVVDTRAGRPLARVEH